MTVSRYIFQKSFADSSVGLYSTRTGSCLCTDQKTADLLAEGRPDCLSADLTRALTQAGMLIEDGTDELAQILGMRKTNPAAFWILTTTACNAACPYCYEKGLPRRTMDPDTAEAAAAFMADRLEASGREMLQLEWFGGEPLLCRAAIDRICARLLERQIRFCSTLTTNGSLLLPEEVSDLCGRWSLAGVQISLDGAGEVHERYRALPEGSFLRIMETIHRLLEVPCHVRIRIVHTGDICREAELIDYLAEEFPTIRPEVYLFPRYETGESGLRRKMEEILDLEQRLADAGLLSTDKAYHFRQRPGRCFAADGGLTIAPDGRLFSCSHAMEDRYCLGSVRDFREDHPLYRSFTASDLPQKCRKCIWLPFCMGGCRAAEQGLAKMFQCHPYSAVTDRIVQIRCGK